jgi:UDP-N-acetylglucosamine diphosphorylase / glucose-1-phosphate thymidylyltransferase / UDP-N-acetylgalactosamine diphosphorylase / glucosamine-1-phosphate N-acetyltransferase / galactosamine-1-phosphate N-acetyltransferase
MPNYILFDDQKIRTNLLPLTFTRPVSEIRCGILTITEKWEKYLGNEITFQTEDYLQGKYNSPSPVEKGRGAVRRSDEVFINSAVCPTSELLEQILLLKVGEVLIQNDIILAKIISQTVDSKEVIKKEFTKKLTIIHQLPDIFLHNGEQIKADFELITKGRKSTKITDKFTKIYAPKNVFVEEGATIRAAILNAEQGPIYIGRNAQIQEGAIIIGPFSAGENSIVAWGSKMRMNTTLGPNCRAGGEVGNSVFFANSNKAHDGFLGNSVIGEWCNLGANCNNSNLKNDYTNVKLFNYSTKKLEDTGTLFCGLFMGDYTKAGISTMFNTGTVVGVNVNVFGAGFQEKHIPSFTWGGAAEGYSEYRFEKAVQVIRETMSRRNKEFSIENEAILRHIFEEARKK